MSSKDQDVLLTGEELVERWKVAIGTLENQRCRSMGPKYLKFGSHRSGLVRYRLSDIIAYEKSILITPKF